MSEAITVKGTVLPDGTLRLDGPVLLPPGPAEVVVRLLPPQVRETGLDVLLRIRSEQEASGYVPPRTAEEIDAHVSELREEWEDRYREIEATQEECRRQRQAAPESKEP